mgnify:CR=1 FL=1
MAGIVSRGRTVSRRGEAEVRRRGIVASSLGPVVIVVGAVVCGLYRVAGSRGRHALDAECLRLCRGRGGVTGGHRRRGRAVRNLVWL